MNPIEETLRKLIPKTCLPSVYSSYEELADALVIQLAGDYALVPKVQYDAMVRKIRRYDQLRKNLSENESYYNRRKF